jgi:lysozyme
MKLSDDGLYFIKTMEGFRDVAYQDVAGVWTIGYGTISMGDRKVQEGDRITEAVAEDYLRADVESSEKAVNDLVRVPLSQPQFDSLVSFVYNLGRAAFANSTLLRYLENRQYVEAAWQFNRWVYAGGKMIPGLAKRRELEKNMFMSEPPPGVEMRYPWRPL